MHRQELGRAVSYLVGTVAYMESFDRSHLAQLRASAASAGLTRDDALAVLEELERLTSEIEQLRDELAAWQGTVRAHEALRAETAADLSRLRIDLSLAEAHAARWKRSYQIALDEREGEADQVELLRAEVAKLQDELEAGWGPVDETAEPA